MKCKGNRLRYSTIQNISTVFTKSSQAINWALKGFAATFTWSLLMFLFRPQTSVHTHLSVMVSNNVSTSSIKLHSYGKPEPIWQQIGSKTLTLGVILLTESQQWLLSQSLWNINNKHVFQSFFNVCASFSIEGCTLLTCTLLKPMKRDWNQAFLLIANIWNHEMHA